MGIVLISLDFVAVLNGRVRLFAGGDTDEDDALTIIVEVGNIDGLMYDKAGASLQGAVNSGDIGADNSEENKHDTEHERHDRQGRRPPRYHGTLQITHDDVDQFREGQQAGQHTEPDAQPERDKREGEQ